MLEDKDELREEVDSLLLGNDSGDDCEDHLAKYAACAKGFTERVMEYEKDPSQFEYEHSVHQVFLARYILHFLNDNSAEGKFFAATVAEVLSKKEKLAFSTRVFTHCRLDRREKSKGFYGTLLTKNISRPMDDLLREKWAKLYWLPKPHAGLFKPTYEPSVDARGQYMHMKAPTLSLTGNSPYEEDWEEEDRRPRPIVSVNGRIMSVEEIKTKKKALKKEFKEKYILWQQLLEASDGLSEVDAVYLEKAKRVEVIIKNGAEILKSRNILVRDPNNKLLPPL